jgi:predicted pyridoxine 5'-phosphate oxidase superfamily flavin-nucleotide-binding protein
MTSKYHAGELAVQSRAGVLRQAERIGNGIRSYIPSVAQDFLVEQRLAAAGTLDAQGRVWASLLLGEPGFIKVLDEQTIHLEVNPFPGDPINENLAQGGPIGLVVIDLSTRRRMRANGWAKLQPGQGITVATSEVFANCPKYIQVRYPEVEPGGTGSDKINATTKAGQLNEQQQNQVARADTFFIATAHPEGGADASHRGGYPGFVQVLDSNRLQFPDFAGNNMFQTLGNIEANPQAGLVFPDFEQGRILQLTGKARIIWDSAVLEKFSGAQRVVEFEVEQVIEIGGIEALRWHFVEYSPFIPASS